MDDPLSSSDLHIAILLGTFNGALFLPEQLSSYTHQTHPNWSLHVSDDGSTDNTLFLISQFQNQNPLRNITLRQGPKQGFATNFLSLLCTLQQEADLYAFSDQDDIWESDKLERAATWFSTVPKTTPALYGTRTLLVDDHNKPLGLSPLFQRTPSFSNALVQSMAGGNTLVMNHAARVLLQKAGTPDIPSHDWWSYFIISSCGGICFYDATPTVRYRQHGMNIVGKNRGIQERLKRASQLFRGVLKKNINRNLQALSSLSNELTLESQKTLTQFEEMRTSSLLTRFQTWPKLNLYRQSSFDDIGLFLAFIMGKV